MQAESSKFASVSFYQGFDSKYGLVGTDRDPISERHLAVFCIDPIVPGFVVYYVN